MNRNNDETQIQEPEEQEKDLISFEDVNAAISGDEDAIIEQLERAKQVAVEQLQKKQQASLEEKAMLQQELAKKEAELKAAREKAKEKIANTKYKTEEAPVVDKTPEPAGQEPVVTTAEEVEQSVQKEPEKKEQQEKKKSPKKEKPQKQPKAEKIKQPKKKVVKVEVRKKKKKEPGNFKYYLVTIFFIALFAFVYFLPEISKYMSERAALKNAQQEIITTGNLNCKKFSNDNNYDYEYNYVFAFQNSKLTKLNIKNVTSGSEKADEEDLEKIKNNCDVLREQIKDLKGIKVKCSFDNYSTTVEQELRYVDIDVNKVTNGYIEAGGTYPNYKYKQNINKIEKDMKAAGYKCERTR